LTLRQIPVKAAHIAELPMRGLLLAFFAVDFPGHGAGRVGASFRSSKTTAKPTAKTV
jgi:hypothetical protein